MPCPSPKRSATSYCAAMSPAIAAARRVGPPIPGGKLSSEPSGGLVAAGLAAAGGGAAGGSGRGGTEPVGSAEFGNGDCDGSGDGDCDAAGGGAGGAAGAALMTRVGAALGWALGTVKDCGAGRAAGVDSVGEFC